MEVNVHQAKTHLSRLLQRVAGGEEITIARAGVPVAKLVAINTRAAARPLGIDRGRFTVPEDFDSPLPDEALALFEGKESADQSRTAKQKTGQSRRRPRR
jgi:prevent-host-death family protein